MSALDNILFPSAVEQPTLSTLLADLKRTQLSMRNRLLSILHDADFVQSIAAAFRRPEPSQRADLAPGETFHSEENSLPLIANERCGSWYVAPDRKAASAYFKSTDGHTNAWKFSTRRLNLHLLKIIEANAGCIIVDSTRRGKSMPDSLSKTIPIWCAVLNRALFPNSPYPEETHSLFTPPTVVSSTEHAQIEALLPVFLASFLALGMNLSTLREQTSKPLRPLWVTPDSDLTSIRGENVFEAFHPVVCCTTSQRAQGGELSTVYTEGHGGQGFAYVQGAGDDTENWAQGLTPDIFWAHKDTIMNAPESDLPGLIGRLIESDRLQGLPNTRDAHPSPIAPGLAVCSLTALDSLLRTGRHGANSQQLEDAQRGEELRVLLLPQVTAPGTWIKSPRRMEIGIGRHKVGSRNLRSALPQICSFTSQYLRNYSLSPGEPQAGTRVIIACETGKDLSVAVALALILWCFDDQGNLRVSQERPVVDKDKVRMRLGGIMAECPEANPGRTSLQSVNSFLMDWRE